MNKAGGAAWWSSNFGHNDRFSCCHIPFEDGGRQIAQYGVQAFTVVEPNDVRSDVDFGFRVVGILALPDAFHFEIQEETFGHGIDAPMSRNVGSGRQIREDERIKLFDDVALQTAMNFLVGHAVCGSALNVGAGSRLASHSDHGNGPQRIVGGAVTAPV